MVIHPALFGEGTPRDLLDRMLPALLGRGKSER
jgi:hypothetical protein